MLVLVTALIAAGFLWPVRKTTRPTVPATGSGSWAWGPVTGAAIPDGRPAGAAFTLPFSVGDPRAVVRSVQVELVLSHPRPEDVQVVLSRGDGTRSVLRKQGTPGQLRALYSGSATQAFVGVPTPGDWKLVVSDLRTGQAGKIDHVKLRADYTW